MKGLALSFSLFLPMIANAQNYLMDYGPGSPAWCWQQQQQYQAMQMQMMIQRQQLLNFYRNQRIAVEQQMMNGQPVQGIVTLDGQYITPESGNNYHREQVPCDNCNGGKITRQYMSNGQVRTQTRTCGYCHGKGYKTQLVENK